MLNRRKLLADVSLGALITAGLAACNNTSATTTTTTTPTTTTTTTPTTDTMSYVASVVQVISAGATTLVNIAGTVAGVTASTLARWQADATQVGQTAVDITSTLTTDAAEPLVQKFESTVETFVSDLSSSSGILPSSAQSALQDIDDILPVLMTVFNIVSAVAQKTPTAAANIAQAQTQANGALSDLQNFINTNVSRRAWYIKF